MDRDIINKNIKAEDKNIFDTCFRIYDRFNLPVEQRNDITLPENNSGAKIKIFSPSSYYKDINDRSLVTVVSYANSKVLIPGDNEPSSWKELLTREDFRDAIKDFDVLLAPHHGRESGYCGEIFDYF